MKLKQKLVLNMAFTGAGIVAIAGFSLSGMKFVQAKLHVLTEQSTPYQVKVYEQQRVLQEHIGNLLRFSVVTTPQELVTVRQDSARTLDVVEKASADLAALKGETGDAGALRGITRDVENASAARIAAYEDVQKAMRQIDDSLARISSSLRNLDRSMKSSQQKMVGEISSANDSLKRSTSRIKSVQQVLGQLNDIKLALTELTAADASEEVASIRTRLDAGLRAMSTAPFLKSEKGVKGVKEVTDAIGEFGRSFGTHCDAVSSSLDPRDEVRRAKALADISRTMKSVNRLIRMLGDSIDAANQAVTADGRRFDDSLGNSVKVSAQLAANGELVALGPEVKAQIRDMFSARTQNDLDRSGAELKKLFLRAATASGALKGAPGIQKVAADFRGIDAAVFGANGAYERLMKITAVTAQATAAAEKLKAVVTEQRAVGETGVEKARLAQSTAITSVNTMFRSSIVLVLGVGVAVLALGIVFSRHLLMSVMKPVNDLGSLASRFNDGDFSARLDGKRSDEFGLLANDFNRTSETLTGIIFDLSGAIRQMVAGVSELSVAVGTIDGAVETQAGLAHECATAMEQMSATVASMAETAGETSGLTSTSRNLARTGQQAVAETVKSMREISESVGAAASVMARLAAGSEKIGGIVDVINDIADQINLLALNAAIEAARAGEQGRGFAVVADQVRVLAARTTEATQDIADMVRTIQGDILSTEQAMQAGRGRVEAGVTIAGDALQCLGDIVSGCDRSSMMVDQIATATEEQAATASEVSSKVADMAGISETTKGAASRIARVTKELDQLSGQLGRQAAWFK